ncbi:MAG: hypothetical protein E7157_03230 [Lactobacillales bacterium]|nr:hypothetical protein [Lactobacillales bacterium]
MKKRNKGFMLIETLVVSTFIITVLIYLYIQFVNLKKSYDTSFSYDTIPGLYSAKEIDKFINNNYGYADFIEEVDSNDNKYIELVDENKCDYIYFSGNINYCDRLISNSNMKTVLLASTDISKLKENLKTNNPYSNELYLYVKNMNLKNLENSYILIVEYNDKTFSYVKIEKTVGEDNE